MLGLLGVQHDREIYADMDDLGACRLYRFVAV